MRKIIQEELNSSSNYSPDAVKLKIGFSVCPLVSLLNGLLHQEDISGCNTSLGHEHSLVSCLGEIFEDPAVGLAILHLDSLDKQANHHVILKLSTLSFHLLSKILTLSRVLRHELMNDLIHLEVNDSYLLR